MNKTVVILRGIPGSGKSTYIKNNFPDAVVCSADHYFTNQKTGEYKFDGKKLKYAHQACKKHFDEAIRNNKPLIAIDNTNILYKHFKEYVDNAYNNNYKIKIITLLSTSKDSFSRNIHGVPLNAIENMFDNLKNNLCFYVENIKEVEQHVVYT